LNLIGIPKSSSYSSLVSYLALNIPTLGLLVILYTNTLSLIRPNILDFLSSFCSYYTIILYLNSSIVSLSLYLTLRSLKSSYFLISILIFRSLGRILYSPSKSSRSIYLSPSLITIYAIDSLIYKGVSYFLSIGVHIYTLNF